MRLIAINPIQLFFTIITAIQNIEIKKKLLKLNLNLDPKILFTCDWELRCSTQCLTYSILKYDRKNLKTVLESSCKINKEFSSNRNNENIVKPGKYAVK